MIATIYLDTGCWIRITETNLDEILRYEKNLDIKEKRRNTIEKERESTLEILEKVRKEPEKYKIVSSKHQIQQLYAKKNNLYTSASQKEALLAVIAFCVELTGDTTLTDPDCNSLRDELIEKSNIQHAEDAKHIVIGCVREADYFVTTDSELYYDKKTDIERSLGLMQPQIPEKHVEIVNPLTFLKKIR